MSTAQFYTELHSFSDFTTLSDEAHYKALPNDWFVVITDVRGSTKAIEQGRYQDVNMLGAASVAVLGNLWRDNGVPFVFGGDGASILVPPARVDEVTRELMKLRNLALANYELELRVGVVPMADVASQGLEILVAKFAAGRAKPIAFMRGGGLSWADSAIKSQPEKYCAREENVGSLGEVKDLSCRWQPLKSRKGIVLAVLARSTSNNLLIFPSVLDHLTDVLGGDVQLSSPVNRQNMKYKSVAASVINEVRLHLPAIQKSFFRRVGWILFSVWSFGYSFTYNFGLDRYTKEIPSHSDFRKFDDMLRLVIDCTPDQVQKIRAYLETLHSSGEIYYGLHESDHAIMTCLVGSVSDGDHIHFIDGGAGGYAMAAKALKEQIAMASSRASAV
jgi:hypothetical protein